MSMGRPGNHMPGNRNNNRFADDKVYLIREYNRPLTCKLRLPPDAPLVTHDDHHHISSKTNNYVIGFRSPVVARKVQYVLDGTITSEEQQLVIRSWNPTDVTVRVNEGLEALGVAATDGSVVVDTAAELIVPKRGSLCGPSNAELAEHPILGDSTMHLFEVPLPDFLMYPFDQNIGIVMPYTLDREDAYSMTFLAQVVDAAGSLRSVRRALTRIYNQEDIQ
jgi:hypothetical protein